VGAELGEQLATGSRSAVFAWGRDAVAKVPLESTPDAWIRFEAIYAVAVRDSGAPAPRLLGIETIHGRAATIYERVHGQSMWTSMLERRQQVPAHARALAELQAHLFSLTPPISLPSLRDRLTCKIRRAAARVDPELAAALDAIPPPHARTHLCHGDLHPGNVIMSREGPVLIDWFDAARGDSLADIARTSLLISAHAHARSGPNHLPGSDRELLDLLHHSYHAAITDLIAPDPIELARWNAVVAAARVSEGVSTERLRAIWDTWRSASGVQLGVGH
jgi:aminoglycoside phosphotransferase (APT) family kinase protein